MNTLFSLLRWCGGRLILLAVLSAVLITGYGVREYLSRADTSAAQLRRTLDLRRESCRRMARDLQRLNREIADLPLYRVTDRLTKQAELRTKEALYETMRAEYRDAQQALLYAEDTTAAKLVELWHDYGIQSVSIAVFLLFLLPLLLKLVMYYGVARLVESLPPQRLTLPDIEGGHVRFISGGPALDVQVAPGGKLLLRAGDWGKKRTGVTARTRFMWSWRHSFVSFAADLCELVEFSAGTDAPGMVTIASPVPNFFISRIDLAGGAVCLRPKFLVGFTGDVSIRTKWSFHLHNLLSGRIRQIVLAGEGTLLIAGAWGADAVRAEPQEPCRVEDGLLIGYEVPAEYALCRTETFWHYLRGQTTLFDRQVSGGMCFTQNSRIAYRKPGESLLERTVNAVLNGVGCLFGF